MLWFGRRYKCILCNKYYSIKQTRYICKGIGICDDCYNEVKTKGDGTYEAKPPVEMVVSPFEYAGNLKKTVKLLKFGGQRLYGSVLGMMMSDALLHKEKLRGFDMIVPVPLHGTRLKERGYNQSEFLSEELSKELEVPLITDAIFRVRDTKRQSGLARQERVENVKSAFYAAESAVKAKNILLVDDIFTTGETAKACGNALKDAGADRVICVALCKTPYKERIILR
ncbi:MAG: ComF family protein [Ruminococcaceae bacterium]|nr:ComF family protein [Oscillospiraceae bacterium]